MKVNKVGGNWLGCSMLSNNGVDFPKVPSSHFSAHVNWLFHVNEVWETIHIVMFATNCHFFVPS